MNKLKIAIFDLTDCEGCELEFINLREKIAKIAEQTDIANWRFASHNHDLGPFDVTFIEGSPITESDIEMVKQARVMSRLIVSLGSCAALGGIQASLSAKSWHQGIKEVYGEKYQTKSNPPKPLSYYIEIDIHLPGCPINQIELTNFLSSLIMTKKPEEVRSPVCLECKANENNCLFLEGKPCLGPITKGGCQAVCPSRGLHCWGCFGILQGSNYRAFKSNLEKKFGPEKTKSLLKNFFSNQEEFKSLYPHEE